jgi:DNA primase
VPGGRNGEGVSFRHAVELLRADVPADPASHPVKTSTVRKLPPPVDRDAGDAAMLEQVVSFYHETLKQSPEALAYLKKRGLTNPEIVSRFRLGFANRTLGAAAAEEEPKSGRRDADATREARHHPRVGTRALQRLDRDSGLRRRRAGG